MTSTDQTDIADQQIATIKSHFTRRVDTLKARAERAEAECDRLAAIVNAARTAAQRLLNQEQENCGSGRDGHLNEDDLVPLLEALGTRYLDEDTEGLPHIGEPADPSTV